MKRRRHVVRVAMLLWLDRSLGAQASAQDTAPADARRLRRLRRAPGVRRAEPVVVTAERFEQPARADRRVGDRGPRRRRCASRSTERWSKCSGRSPAFRCRPSGSPGKLSTIRIRGANPPRCRC